MTKLTTKEKRKLGLEKKREKKLWIKRNAMLKKQCKKCGRCERLFIRTVQCKGLGNTEPLGRKCEYFTKKRKKPVFKIVPIYVRNETGRPAHCDLCGNVVVKGYRIRLGKKDNGKYKFRYETNPNVPVALHWRVMKNHTHKPFVHAHCMAVSYREKRVARANGMTVLELIQNPHPFKTPSPSIFGASALEASVVRTQNRGNRV